MISESSCEIPSQAETRGAASPPRVRGYGGTRSSSSLPFWCPLPGSGDLNELLKIKKLIPSFYDAIVLWEEKSVVVFKTSDVCKKSQSATA